MSHDDIHDVATTYFRQMRIHYRDQVGLKDIGDKENVMLKQL